MLLVASASKKVIEGQHECIFCRAQLKDETRLVESNNKIDDGDIGDARSGNQSGSSQVHGLISGLRGTLADQKKVVFSQWIGVLDSMEGRLERKDYKPCRIDGTMPAPRRDIALGALNTDRETTIMLVMLGIDGRDSIITAANNVLLCNTWWTPAIDYQARGRSTDVTV